jgi:hypothetical protein
MSGSFYRNTPFKDREATAKKILRSSPNSIPVVVSASSQLDPICRKCKFIIPGEKKMSFVFAIIRGRMDELDSTETLFFYAKSDWNPNSYYVALTGSLTLDECYFRYASRDGLLYLTYARENVFG